MAKLSKDERRQRIKQWQIAARARDVSSMPMTPEQLLELLDYLDVNLTSCDHTTKLTSIFLHVERLDEELVLSWLADKGGFCDCDVLYNLFDFAEAFREHPAPPRPQLKRIRAPRDLNTRTGWDLTALPKPWRVANRYEPDEPLKIQMGRKGGCSIQFVDSTMPPGDQTTDNYWSQLWYTRTELPERSPIRVSRETLDVPDHLRTTVVQTSMWTPVYCWLLPDKKQVEEWFLEIKTESNRQQGDLAQAAALITKLATESQ